MELENLNIHKSLNILDFEKGEFITRVFRSERKDMEYNENLMVSIEVDLKGDGSYLGDKLEFKGIYNRMICLINHSLRFSEKRQPIKLHFDEWQNGWQKYEIPKEFI